MVTKHPPILVTYYSKHLFLFYALCGGGTALHKHLGAQSDGGSIILKLKHLEDKPATQLPQ